MSIRRLVDCTYLHSVGRCLNGEAIHRDDLANFLRFIGEVLISDRLHFTADPTGPVYGPATEVVKDISARIGTPRFITHFDSSVIDHVDACRRTAMVLASDILSFRFVTQVGQPHGSISPQFTGLAPDPDRLLFDDLREMVRTGRGFPRPTTDGPAGVPRFVLSQPAVVKALSATSLLDSFDNEDAFLALTAAVRALVYRHIGIQLRAGYLPATARAKLLIVPPRFLDDIGTIPRDVGQEDQRLSLATAVDALVQFNSGHPGDILTNAWAWRDTLIPLRKHLLPRVPGDALAVSFDAAKENRTLNDAFSRLMDGIRDTSILDIFEVEYVFFGAPNGSIKMSPGRLKDWLDHRRASRRVRAFADFVRPAKYMDTLTA
jgi:hypothetical protein